MAGTADGADCAIMGRAPNGLPAIGHLGAFLRSPLGFLRNLPGHGDLVEVRFGPQRVLVVCDPGLTRELLLNDRVFDKGGPLYDRLREAGGNGLATCPARDHRRQRRLVQPAFHRARLPEYARTMTRVVDTATAAWVPGQRVDLVAETRSMAASILLSTVFGTALAPANRDRLAEDLRTILDGIPARAVLPDALLRLPTPGNLRHRRANRRARHIMAALVRELRHDPGDGMFGALLTATDPTAEDRPPTDEELVDQAVTMYAGGTETTSGAVAWAVHLAAADPEAGRRLTDECRSVLGDRAPTWEDLPRLDQARRVLLEAIRLHPPGWLLTRTATTDTRLGAYPVPRGTTLAYSPYLLGRLPALYEDPDRFHPDRWAPGTGGAPASVPTAVFGGGARKCIGDEFALAEGVLMLAGITARWDVHPEPGGLKGSRLPGLTLNPARLTVRVTPARPAADPRTRALPE